MRLRALRPCMGDNFERYNADEEFDVSDERGNLLLFTKLVERVDAPPVQDVVRRPGRPRKTEV